MNTLKYAKNLEEVGFSREQAEMTVGILNEVVESSLATKEDLKDLRHDMQVIKQDLQHDMHQFKREIRHDMQKFRQEVQHDMQKFRQEVQHDMHQLKSELVIKLGAMMVTAIAVVSALVKIL